MTSFVGALLRVVHLVEPVGAAGEPAPVEDHAHSKIRVMNVVIEWNTPHHNQTGVQMLNLPADSSTCASRSSSLQINDNS